MDLRMDLRMVLCPDHDHAVMQLMGYPELTGADGGLTTRCLGGR